MPDYTALAATALRLVTDAGTAVSLVRLGSTPADSSKPWRGQANPRSPAAETVAGFGVFVQPAAAERLGIAALDSDFVKRAEAIAIVTLSTTPVNDIKKFDELVVGAQRWRIQGVEQLKPATTTLLYFVSVAQ